MRGAHESVASSLGNRMQNKDFTSIMIMLKLSKSYFSSNHPQIPLFILCCHAMA